MHFETYMHMHACTSTLPQFHMCIIIILYLCKKIPLVVTLNLLTAQAEFAIIYTVQLYLIDKGHWATRARIWHCYVHVQRALSYSIALVHVTIAEHLIILLIYLLLARSAITQRAFNDVHATNLIGWSLLLWLKHKHGALLHYVDWQNCTIASVFDQNL